MKIEDLLQSLSIPISREVLEGWQRTALEIENGLRPLGEAARRIIESPGVREMLRSLSSYDQVPSLDYASVASPSGGSVEGTEKDDAIMALEQRVRALEAEVRTAFKQPIADVFAAKKKPDDEPS